jgi:hypothetical protein
MKLFILKDVKVMRKRFFQAKSKGVFNPLLKNRHFKAHILVHVVNINVYPLTCESFFPNIFRQNKRIRRNSDAALLAGVGDSDYVCVQPANQTACGKVLVSRAVEQSCQ